VLGDYDIITSRNRWFAAHVHESKRWFVCFVIFDME